MVFVPAMFGSGGFEVVGHVHRNTWTSTNNPYNVGWPAGCAPGDFAILLIEAFGDFYGPSDTAIVNDTGWTAYPPTFLVDPGQNRKGAITCKILTSGDLAGNPPQINGNIGGAWMLLVLRGANGISANRGHYGYNNDQSYANVSVQLSGGLGKSLTSVAYFGFTFGGRFGTLDITPNPDYAFTRLNPVNETVNFWLLPAEAYAANSLIKFDNFNDGVGWRGLFFQEVIFA